VTHHSYDQSLSSIAELVRVSGLLGKSAEEIFHLKEARDLAGVVTEDKATHGHQDAHQSDSPGYQWMFGIVDLAGL
jgi:hypothetical protein